MKIYLFIFKFKEEKDEKSNADSETTNQNKNEIEPVQLTLIPEAKKIEFKATYIIVIIIL